MAARLRAKRGGERIAVTIGDFGEVPVDGSFSLVYVVAGTFFELLTQRRSSKVHTSSSRTPRAAGGRSSPAWGYPSAH